ncbi:nucleotidyltransferase family protein [Terracidiphilus sp.]|jgi:D-glycero-alpha-D-manno-heptose 1-phosphate guanylyltransferase|uniref:nucleotidyltransferase family protein n=1 Tax=Terracidiphilus sp. TaxID=1964191 RepID=UPI003C1C1859
MRKEAKVEAIILAGGLGTRLSSRLVDRPKSMALVAGRPFLAILLDRLVQSGCTHVLLSVGHLHSVIMDAFGDSYRGIPITYVVEETPLGTGGAIRKALDFSREDCSLVLNGDTYVDLDSAALLEFHRAGHSSITLAVAQVADSGRYGRVRIEREGNTEYVTGFEEKGQSGEGWINAGVYALNREFSWPGQLAERFSFENDVLAPDVGSLRPLAFRHAGYFLDIGVPADLDRAESELADR